MQIFYIDDNYDDKARAFYENYKVTLPVKNVPYTIREVVLIQDQFVLLLNEIKNEQVVVNKKPMGEPGFHYARFTDIPGNVLEWEKVGEIYKKSLGRNPGSV